MSRLSARERLLAAAALLAVAAAALARLVAVPALERWRALDQRIAAAELKLARGRHLLDHAGRIEAEHARVVSARREAGSEPEEMGAFLREVEALARQNLLPITDLRPLPVETKPGRRLFAVELEARADPARLARFLYGVEAAAPSLRVDRLSLASAPDGAAAKITVSKVLLGGSPKAPPAAPSAQDK